MSSKPSSHLLHHLSRWFGHRAATTPPPKRPSYEICIWSFIGSFCGIALIQAVFGHAHYFIRKGAPPIVASYGASAVLIYGAIDKPVSQPRALVGGQFLGALTGVCITKLFQLLPSEKLFQELLWLCGSLACACSVVVMQVTQTTHPPAGATAILAAISPGVRAMGWYYLPVILLSSTLAMTVALIINNIRRRYPLYWFRAPIMPSPYIENGTAASTRVNSVEALPVKEKGTDDKEGDKTPNPENIV